VREYAAIEGDEVLEEIKDSVYSGASLKRTEELRDNDPIQSEWDGEEQAIVGGVYYRPAVRSPAPDLSRGG
jgi:hypothetical protein